MHGSVVPEVWQAGGPQQRRSTTSRHITNWGDLPMSAVEVTRPLVGVAQITLNRPDRRNALNYDLLAGFYAALDDLAGDGSCRVIVLTGAGAGFCSGLDLAEGATPPDVTGSGRAQNGMRVQKFVAGMVPALREQPQPVIAAVNGAASGGGLALALGSDIRIAATSARFNVAFVRVGLSGCDVGVSWMLPRLIGASRAYELMLTGRFVDSAEAERIGLVATVVADDALLDAAYAEAELILANSPFGVRMTKEVMWSQLEIGSLHAGIDLENRTQILSSTSGDLEEAMAAFLEKRPPVFRDV
jgi:enoyl-CoA hydratase